MYLYTKVKGNCKVIFQSTAPMPKPLVATKADGFSFDKKLNGMTKEETQKLYDDVMTRKRQLEIKINCDYLPLQRQRDALFKKSDFKTIMTLESDFNRLQKEISGEFDEIVRLRKTYFKFYEIHSR